MSALESTLRSCFLESKIKVEGVMSTVEDNEPLYKLPAWDNMCLHVNEANMQEQAILSTLSQFFLCFFSGLCECSDEILPSSWLCGSQSFLQIVCCYPSRRFDQKAGVN